MYLGELIYKYRKENNITMQQFADKSGLSKAYISMLEKNKHPQSKRNLIPSIDTCMKIAQAMNIPFDELIGMLDGNQDIHIPSNDKRALSDREEQLLSIFRCLNEEGQDKLIDNGRDLVASGRYIKNNESSMVGEKSS